MKINFHDFQADVYMKLGDLQTGARKVLYGIQGFLSKFYNKDLIFLWRSLIRIV